MNLLVITQKVDSSDPVLGFFHRWLEEFSRKYANLVVICLEKGKFSLPSNVKVLSLGKERGESRLKYILRFYKYIWGERKNYDTVFVHMNQEYIILGWKLWKLMGKKIWLWRNHPKGSVLTNFAVWVSDRVFCTSKYSYTARFKKTEIMPVGIDTELFRKKPEIKKEDNLILSLGRIAPIKRVEKLIEALNILNKEKFDFRSEIAGDADRGSGDYYESIKNKAAEYGLGQKIIFRKSVAPGETAGLYNRAGLFVNFTPTGSMDKTIFEAMACETLVLTSNRALRDLIDNVFVVDENNAVQTAEAINKIISLKPAEKALFGAKMREFVVREHSLAKLIKMI